MVDGDELVRQFKKSIGNDPEKWPSIGEYSAETISIFRIVLLASVLERLSGEWDGGDDFHGWNLDCLEKAVRSAE